MSAQVERRQVTLPPAFNLSGSRVVGWWGMVMLIVTEATVFAALISSYFYLRFNSATWPTGSIERPELLLASINSVILISSSWPMQMAVRSIRRGYQGGVQIGLVIAWLLGVLFLFFQGVEYANSTFTPQTNVYGSLYFTILSLHGLHVLVGLLLASVVVIRSWRGHFSEHRFQAIEITALYWHFVDAVWIVIFASLYLSPYVT